MLEFQVYKQQLAQKAWLVSSFNSFTQKFTFLIRLMFGILILIFKKVYGALRYQILPRLYNVLSNVFNYVFKIAFNSLWAIYQIIKFTILIIFEPFNLIIKIIDYNTRQFINIFLQFFFNTKIEKIFTKEYGYLQFQIIVEWIRFINVVCITSLILGIITYYTAVRLIYWATRLEKQKSKTKVQVVEDVQESSKEKAFVNNSLFDEFIKQQQLQFSNNSKQQILSQSKDEDGSSTILDEAPIDASSDVIEPDESHLLDEDEEDDVFNYQSLNSLSNDYPPTYKSEADTIFSLNGTRSTSSRVSSESPLTNAFRRRLQNQTRIRDNETEHEEEVEESDDDRVPDYQYAKDSNPSTVTSTLFGTLNIPMTPITTIEEEEDEDEDAIKTDFGS